MIGWFNQMGNRFKHRYQYTRSDKPSREQLWRNRFSSRICPDDAPAHPLFASVDSRIRSPVSQPAPGRHGLLREPTAIDIPSGTADGVCVRRAEEDNEICDLLWGDKLEGGLFFDKKFHSSIGRGNVPFRNPIIDLFLD